MTSYGIDPGLSRLFPAKTSSKWAKSKGEIPTFPIGDALAGFESMIPGQSQVSGELFQSLLSGLQGQFPEEYFQTSIAGPMKKEFESYLAPAIREEFVGPGTYWGTGRTAAVGRGREELTASLAAKRAELAMTTKNQALQAALAYLGIPLMSVFQNPEYMPQAIQDAMNMGGGGSWKTSAGFKQAAGNEPQATAAPEWDPNSLVSKLAYWDYYNIPEEKRYLTIGEAIANMMRAGKVSSPILGGPTYQAGL